VAAHSATVTFNCNRNSVLNSPLPNTQTHLSSSDLSGVALAVLYEVTNEGGVVEVHGKMQQPETYVGNSWAQWYCTRARAHLSSECPNAWDSDASTLERLCFFINAASSAAAPDLPSVSKSL
jgi:hypothetical protein